MLKSVKYTLLVLVLISCRTFDQNTSVLSNSSVESEEEYYNKAVLEYHLVNSVIKRRGEERNDSLFIEFDARNSTMKIDCGFQIPDSVQDLKSGFEYKYYAFDGSMKGVMQAFGIADVSADKKTKYFVIDYIQYRDYKCEYLPTIRYAVGIRSELRILDSEYTADLQGIGKLSDLAANVQIGNAEVEFSLKTIGLTGEKARLNIPQGVSFDVSTYKDFQNTIEFIKKDLELDTPSLVVRPEIIPVMDEYRPNTYYVLNETKKQVLKLQKELNKVRRMGPEKLGRKKLDADLKMGLEKMYLDGIKRLTLDMEALTLLNDKVYSVRRYEKLLKETLADELIADKQQERIKRSYDQTNLQEGFYGLANLDSLPESDLKKFDKIMDDDQFTLGIRLDVYDDFLAKLNSTNPSAEEFREVIQQLEAIKDERALIVEDLQKIIHVLETN